MISSIFASCLTLLLWILPAAPANAIALPGASVAVLPGLEGIFAGDTPDLGLQDGHLMSCPDKPNCVVSQGPEKAHHIEPIAYTSDREAVRNVLVQVLAVVPRTEIVTQTDAYIRAKSTSRLMGFVDDLEFYLPPNKAVIHVRSAARLGESDLGVNRRRLEQIRLALRDLGI